MSILNDTPENPVSGIPELDEYAELQQQIAVLQARADDLRAAAMRRAAAIVRAIMDQHGLSVDDLQPRARAHVDRRAPRPLYQDPQSGSTWSGYGREPQWIKGKDRAPFRIRGTT